MVVAKQEMVGTSTRDYNIMNQSYLYYFSKNKQKSINRFKKSKKIKSKKEKKFSRFYDESSLIYSKKLSHHWIFNNGSILR